MYNYFIHFHLIALIPYAQQTHFRHKLLQLYKHVRSDCCFPVLARMYDSWLLCCCILMFSNAESMCSWELLFRYYCKYLIILPRCYVIPLEKIFLQFFIKNFSLASAYAKYTISPIVIGRSLYCTQLWVLIALFVEEVHCIQLKSHGTNCNSISMWCITWWWDRTKLLTTIPCIYSVVNKPANAIIHVFS